MSSFPSIARALSPHAASQSAFFSISNDDATVRDARHAALLSCRTLEELIELIPSDYKEVLADQLRKGAAHCERLVKARSTVGKWKHHLSVGTFPPHLRTSAAKVQFTAGYSDTAAARAAQQSIDDAHLAYQKDSLTKAIAARDAEVVYLEEAIEPLKAREDLLKVLEPLSHTVVARYKVPLEERDENGVVTNIVMAQAPAAIAIRDQVLGDCGIYASCVVSITLNRAAALDRKIEKKKTVAAAAQVAAGDGDTVMGDATVTAALKAEVKRQVMGLMPRENRKPKGNAQVKAARVSANSDRYSLIADFFAEGSGTSSSQGHPAQGERQQVCLRSPWVHSYRKSASLTEHVSKHEEITAQEEVTRQEAGLGGIGKGRGSNWRRPEEERSEREGEGAVDVDLLADFILRTDFTQNKGGKAPLIAPGELWVSQPKTMPDFLTSLPLPDAVSVVLANCSLRWLEEMKFQQYVHLSPGVHVPTDIAFNLSLGSKYMFSQPANARLIKDAWMDFQRRLRWRIMFMFEGGSTEAYDPDYDVRGPSGKTPPKLPQYIELGLVKGRIFVNKAMSKVPDPDDSNQGTTYKPKVRAIQQFLAQHEYVVTGTDKNLGLAVSRRDWIIQKCQDCLNSVNDYKELTLLEANKILDQKCKEMEVLATAATQMSTYYGKQMGEFLRSKITLAGKAHHIPKFYGIPKIHKVPTKMRPIIPCHTAIMNPAAKICSKILKPLIHAAPTIIHGTKDLAQKLSQLNIDPTRKWYIVTGDVVAFYPNIPLQHCINIVYELYFEHYWGDRADRFQAHNERAARFIYLCLEYGNTKLLTQFQGKIYEQLNGLAMGVADSPDLANLYGYYFERKSRVLEHPDVFFYGRYIDDCLAVVYADDNQSAINLLQSLIRFDNCVIEWAKPGSSQPFLDMLLYQDKYNCLQHMPYRKAGNHQERIPWISAHPLDVKRGTFLGEMSRLATISSKHEHYIDALTGLVSLYIHRGYPPDLVRNWLNSNIQVRWDKRLLNQPKTDASTLVLKTEYNLAWDYFNAHEFGQVIFDYWGQWLEHHSAGNYSIDYPRPPRNEAPSVEEWDLAKTDIFNSRVIVSRKRTRNFLDLTNTWKRSVLETLEDHVLDDLVDTAARYTASKRTLDYDINTQVAGPSRIRTAREATDPDDDVFVRESSPKTSDAWRSGASGTWGRGARP